MNSFELHSALKSHCKLENEGVFACDKLPKFANKPSALICNTQPSNMPGEHWIAIYLDINGKGEYFDSYGMPPLKSEFAAFLKTNCKKNWSFNNKELQDWDSDVCGQYCLAYLSAKGHGCSLNQFLKKFDTNNKKKNDLMVAKMVKPSCDGAKNCLKAQSCCSRRRSRSQNGKVHR